MPSPPVAVEEAKSQSSTLEDLIPVESIEAIAKHLLESAHFFRLTIDLKKLRLVPPLQTRVEEDDDFVGSVSLSYLTAPLFQSTDVFHAVQISRNPKDSSELLISDGFCSFRFEDRLHWSDFARLFLPCREAEGEPSGATLPIFVRARPCLSERKSTTIGVASLTFESFLTSEPPTLDQIPQSFYSNLVSFEPMAENDGDKSPPGGGLQPMRELPVFEGLMRIPVITRESATIVGVVTLGVAVDLMLAASELGALLAKTLHRVTPIHPLRRPEDQTSSNSSNDPVEQSASPQTHSGRHVRKRSCNGSNPSRNGGSKISVNTPVSDHGCQTIRSTRVHNRQESDDGSAEDDRRGGGRSPPAPQGGEQILQCEIMLMKLAAEQQANKFREEMRQAERKAEERLNEVKAENQKLRSENQSLEKKLGEFEKKLGDLQKAMESSSGPSPCRRDRSMSGDPMRDTIEELRRQNDRLLQLLLRHSDATPGDCTSFLPTDLLNTLSRQMRPPQATNGWAAILTALSGSLQAAESPMHAPQRGADPLGTRPIQRTGRHLPPPLSTRIPSTATTTKENHPSVAVQCARDSKGIRSISPTKRAKPGILNVQNRGVDSHLFSGRKAVYRRGRETAPEMTAALALSSSDSSSSAKKVSKRIGPSSNASGRKTTGCMPRQSSSSSSSEDSENKSTSSSPLSSRSRQLIAQHLKKSSS